MENDEIMLTVEDRKKLEDFTRKGVHSVRLIKRARVILALDRAGKVRTLRIRDICTQEELSRQALYDIRAAYLRAPDIETFLTRKKREKPPVEPKVTGELEANIIAIACGKKPEGRARWTMQLIADRCVEMKLVDSLSEISVRRVLKKHNLNLT